MVAPDGSELGSGSANLPRPDLAALGFGRTNFAFRVPIPEVTGRTQLRVLARDAELPGSPVFFEPGRYCGVMEIHNGVIGGWVCAPGRAASAPLVKFTGAFGRELGAVQSLPAAPADPMFSPGFFKAELPASCFGRDEVEIAASAGNSIFASTRAAARLRGYLDILTPDLCTGWLISPDAPGRRFEIAVFRNGIEIGRGVCRHKREELRERFPDHLDIGFAIKFEQRRAQPCAPCELSFRLAGTDVELFEGPFIAGNRTAMIGAAREAARKLSDTPLTQAERAILNTALSRFQDSARRSGEYTRLQSAPPTARIPRRIEILIPIYKDIAITKACIESVLHARCPETDRILLFNDASPEPGMASMLEQFAGLPNVVVMTNESNLGFVRTVNGGLRFLRDGDVLLLNSDTIVYPGGIGELWRAAHASPSIGTATALSNNATIFSYPHPQLPAPELDDVSWEELAAFALVDNAGCSVDVPTANGFCMLIKREVLDRLGGFDEAFGRGYGEENDFCFRAFGLGYRHIAAAGAFVQHLDSVSFGAEKASLMSGNLGLLNSKYPEYTPIVMAFEAADPLRRARWALDAFRLRRLVAAGTRFTLVVQTWLRGGTRKAIADIEQAAGGGGKILRLTAREDGMLELTAAGLKLRAVFQDSELDSLFSLLADAQVRLAVVHQLLGYGAGFIRRLTRFAAARHAVAFVHDFYAACPRVNLIDPTNRFCGVAGEETCGRCIALGGAHEASMLNELAAAEHRVLFQAFFAACRHVVVPSRDTARHLGAAFPDIAPVVLPHLHVGGTPARARAVGNGIALLGAIGAHKGSALLLDIARLARLTQPEQKFHVIGYTDIDSALLEIGNVVITGEYRPDDLPLLLDKTDAGIALFLHGWPETFSYTLTEAVMQGLLPLVPDIGAPADRVRASGIGAVFPFPASPAEILTAIGDLQAAGPAPITQTAFARFTGVTAPADIARLLAPQDADAELCLEVGRAN